MIFSLQTNELVYPNINIRFNESIYAVSDDTEFECDVRQRFNSNIIFPNYATCVRIGGYPIDFNYPIEVPNTVTDLHNMFRGCSNYNQQFNIPNGVVNCESLFNGCTSYDRPTTIPETVSNLGYMFSSCTKFNQPVTIPNEAVSCGRMFSSAYMFNQPVNIPGNVTNCVYMFGDCYNFNQPVLLNESDLIRDCVGLFSGCRNFNQSVVVPQTVNNMAYMFNGANNMNSPVYLYMQNTTNAYYMFLFCNSISQIYINGLKNNMQTRYMLRNNGSNMLNIYTDDIGQNILSTASYLMVNGFTPTWTADSANGCIYNTSMNVYVYNNWDGVVA